MTANEKIVFEAQANLNKAGAMLALCSRAEKMLYDAQQKLGSARNWGIIDILGGGLITDLIKHSKLDGVRQHLHQARPLLEELGRELKDFDLQYGPELDAGGFATFADFFFDGLFADLYMQSKIRNLAQQLDAALDQLGRVENALTGVREYEARRIRKAQE